MCDEKYIGTYNQSNHKKRKGQHTMKMNDFEKAKELLRIIAKCNKAIDASMVWKGNLESSKILRMMDEHVITWDFNSRFGNLDNYLFSKVIPDLDGYTDIYDDTPLTEQMVNFFNTLNHVYGDFTLDDMITIFTDFERMLTLADCTNSEVEAVYSYVTFIRDELESDHKLSDDNDTSSTERSDDDIFIANQIIAANQILIGILFAHNISAMHCLRKNSDLYRKYDKCVYDGYVFSTFDDRKQRLMVLRLINDKLTERVFKRDCMTKHYAEFLACRKEMLMSKYNN